MSLIPIYTPGWRETKWSKVLCLRKKRDGQGLNPGSPDSEFEVLTTRPHTPTNFMMCTSWNVDFRSMQEAHLGFTNMDKPHLASCSHFKILHSPISSSPAISYSWEILVEVKAPMKKLNEQKGGMGCKICDMSIWKSAWTFLSLIEACQKSSMGHWTAPFQSGH